MRTQHARPPEPAAAAHTEVDGDFASFYAESYRTIARALAVTLGNVDRGVEAADEAMLRAYERWDRIGHYDNPGGWVFRVGLNWARSLHRRLGRQIPLAGLRREPATEFHVIDPAVHQAVAALSTKLRSVVVCRLLLDLTVAETAAALEVPEGTVKSRLHSALSKLESSLEDPR